MSNVKLVFIKSIQRKETRGRDRAWGFFHDDRSCPHKMFTVAEYDRGIIDQLKEAGLDLDRMIHHEVITCKILVRYELKPLRAGSLDAKRPTIVNIEKLVESQQSAYDRIAELMKQYGYSPKDALHSTPHYIVGDCVPYGSLPVVGRDRKKLINLAEEWLEKWQAKKQITAASAPIPVVENVQPVVPEVDPVIADLRKAGEALEAQAFAPLFEQSPKVAYFTRLLAEMPAPVTASAPLLMAAPAAPVALLPAWCETTVAEAARSYAARLRAPDLGVPISVPCEPLPAPRLTMRGVKDIGMSIFVDGVRMAGVALVPVNFVDVRVESVGDLKRGDGRTHPSPFASRSQQDPDRDEQNREIFTSFMEGASRVQQ